MSSQNLFTWRHFEAEIMFLCVRWYLCYSPRYRDLEEMMRERDLHVDHTTISRWVQKDAPEREKRCRPHLKACNDSWRVDETSMKVKNVWVSLYRAVDSQGNTIEFFLSPMRDAEAAKRFFCKALPVTVRSASHILPDEERMTQHTSSSHLHTTVPMPRVINVDTNAASPKAISEWKAAGILPQAVERRQVNSLNNLIEQDHRFIKR